MHIIDFETAAQRAEEANGSAYMEHASIPEAPIVKKAPSDSEARLRLFEETILPHLNSAYNLARWLTRNEDDAQDVVQESYLRAFRFFDSYNGGDGKSWLLEVVRNTCFTLHRREKRSAASVAFDEAAHTPRADRPSAEDALVQAGDRKILQHCIEALPEAFREVLVMRELEEMSYRQIAEVSGLAPGTVMSRLSRARKRLEDCVRARDLESYK
jgi:RNA polymerase sigma-70 factor, ECF subfamily